MELLKINDVCARLKMSETTIYRLHKDGKFPKKHTIGRLVYWKSTDIDNYIVNLGQEEKTETRGRKRLAVNLT